MLFSEKGQGLVEYVIILVVVPAFIVGLLGFGFAAVWNLLLGAVLFTITWWQALLMWFVFVLIIGVVGRAFGRKTITINFKIQK